MNLAEIAAFLGLNLALILAAMLGLWALALRLGRIDFIDGVWPLAMVVLAGVAFVVTEGDPVRKGLLLWLVAIWAGPRAWRRLSPAARHEADARYARVADVAAAPRAGAAAVGQCQADSSRFGCYATVENGKAEATICVD